MTTLKFKAGLGRRTFWFFILGTSLVGRGVKLASLNQWGVNSLVESLHSGLRVGFEAAIRQMFLGPLAGTVFDLFDHGSHQTVIGALIGDVHANDDLTGGVRAELHIKGGTSAARSRATCWRRLVAADSHLDKTKDSQALRVETSPRRFRAVAFACSADAERREK